MPDFAAGQGQAQIQFVVLVAQQRFVKAADAVKDAAPINAAENGVRGAFVQDVVPARPADCERTVMSNSDRLL